MFSNLRHLLVRYWLVGVVASLGLLTGYATLPVLGATPTPTPDVQTVPPLEELLTPTNTPFPTATPTTKENTTTTPKSTPEPTNTPTAPTTDPGAGAGSANPPPLPPASAPGNSSGGLTGTVLDTVLELRRVPDANARLVDTVFRNETVTILARTPDNLWWLVCCGQEKREGWVLAKALQPNFDAAKATSLIPIANNINTLPTGNNSSGVSGQKPLTGTQQVTPTLPLLQLEMRPSPAFAWQGQQVELLLVVTNVGKTPVSNVRLRDDLPRTLAYRKLVVSNNGRGQQKPSTQGGALVTIDWPTIAPGAKVSAVLTLQIAADLPDGALIDNLAVVSVGESAAATAGITFAMPPTLAPSFR